MAIQFSDTTNKSGLIQLCEMYTGLGDGGISGSATLLKQFTRLINNGVQKAIAAIVESQDDWQWDDANVTSTYPVAKRTLAVGQRDYKFTSALWSLIGVEGGSAGSNAAITPLKIRRVDVTYDGTNWIRALPIDTEEMPLGLGNDTNTDGRYSTGAPRYDARSSALWIYPAPVTTGASVQLEFTREFAEFVSTDTTKTLPIDTAFAPMAALDAAADFCAANAPSLLQAIQMRYADLEARLRRHYGRKDEDRTLQLQGNYVNYT